jgi:hypothetical protein
VSSVVCECVSRVSALARGLERGRAPARRGGARQGGGRPARPGALSLGLGLRLSGLRLARRLGPRLAAAACSAPAGPLLVASPLFFTTPRTQPGTGGRDKDGTEPPTSVQQAKNNVNENAREPRPWPRHGAAAPHICTVRYTYVDTQTQEAGSQHMLIVSYLSRLLVLVQSRRGLLLVRVGACSWLACVLDVHEHGQHGQS